MSTSAVTAPAMAQAPTPVSALLLGLAGLLPFWSLAITYLGRAWLGVSGPSLDLVLATYAAMIISFLGGIRWSLAVSGPAGGGQYALSVIPSLVAWAALAVPEPWRLGDSGHRRPWPRPARPRARPCGSRAALVLRLILSTGAGVALLLAAFG